MKKLRVGGEAAIIIKNTFLTNEPSGATGGIRRQLLENFNLHTILDLPGGVFSATGSTGVQTVVLFFRKGEPTKNIFYYQLNVGRNLGKSSPLKVNDMTDFLEKYKSREVGTNSWFVSINDVDSKTLDIGVNNPTEYKDEDSKSPSQILEDINLIETDIAKILSELKV